MSVKKREIERILRAKGYFLTCNNGPHEKWSNGKTILALPRKKEINKMTAKQLFKKMED